MPQSLLTGQLKEKLTFRVWCLYSSFVLAYQSIFYFLSVWKVEACKKMFSENWVLVKPKSMNKGTRAWDSFNSVSTLVQSDFQSWRLKKTNTIFLFLRSYKTTPLWGLSIIPSSANRVERVVSSSWLSWVNQWKICSRGSSLHLAFSLRAIGQFFVIARP